MPLILLCLLRNENDLQKLCQFQIVAGEFNLTISVQKTKATKPSDFITQVSYYLEFYLNYRF